MQLSDCQAPRFIDDGRLYAPAALRNQAALIALLQDVLPQQGQVLEIASGTGEHAVAFGQAFPDLVFQPSEPNAACRISIEVWIRATRIGNVLTPLALDAAVLPWPVAPVNAVLCVNLLHLAAAPIGAVAQGAASALKPGGLLITYGPFDPDMADRIKIAATSEGLISLPPVAMPDRHLALLFRLGE